MPDSVDRHKHNGIRTYAGTEATNVVLGQNGFDILQGVANTTGRRWIAGEEGTNTTNVIYKPEVRFWVAIKAINGADSSVLCKSLQGQHLSRNGNYYTTGSTYNIDLQDQDLINGCFQEIRICDAATFLIAYRG